MPCTDGIQVTEDEAVELALHHAILAAKFFEATPDPFPINEIIRILDTKNTSLEKEPIIAFFRALDKSYSENSCA